MSMLQLSLAMQPLIQQVFEPTRGGKLSGMLGLLCAYGSAGFLTQPLASGSGEGTCEGAAKGRRHAVV